MINLYPVLRPFVFCMDPEKAHNMTIKASKAGLNPVMGCDKDDSALAVEAFGLKFPNPVGLAAGFDKNAEVRDPMLGMGFGFVEAGTVTPHAQPGNEKPRLFRLEEDRAVINRFGLNRCAPKIWSSA